MEEGVYHEMRAKEDRFWWHRGMREIHKAILDVYFRKDPGNEILDVGCGTGGMLETLSRYGSVRGIDFSDIAVGHARSRNVGTVIKAEADKIPFNDRTFDLVSCFDVLYHRAIENDELVLKEFLRVLKPGGSLLIREPAFWWLYGRHDQIVWTSRRYSKKELVRKIENAGFDVIKSSYVNFFLMPFIFINRLLAPKLTKPDNNYKSTFIDYPILSQIFKTFLLLEARLIKHINFPLGSSVICFARKR